MKILTHLISQPPVSSTSPPIFPSITKVTLSLNQLWPYGLCFTHCYPSGYLVCVWSSDSLAWHMKPFVISFQSTCPALKFSTLPHTPRPTTGLTFFSSLEMPCMNFGTHPHPPCMFPVLEIPFPLLFPWEITNDNPLWDKYQLLLMDQIGVPPKFTY